MSPTKSSKKIDSLAKRNQLYNHAVSLRESGHLVESLTFFKQIAGFDKKHNRYQDLIDVFGHIRITYTRLADDTNSTYEKNKYLYKALLTLKDAISIANTHQEITKGSKSILSAHTASLILKISLINSKYKKELLSYALKHIDKALKDLPGSEAHKSWPANTKAQILLELENLTEATKVITKAENWLKTGKKTELQSNDPHSRIKIDVWTTGIYLTKAKIYMAELKPILARFYAQLVLDYPTISDHLTERKKDAKKLIQEINEKFWYINQIDTFKLSKSSTIQERYLTLETSIKAQKSSLKTAKQALKLVEDWDNANKYKQGKIETQIANLYIKPHYKTHLNPLGKTQTHEIDKTNPYIKIAEIQDKLNQTTSKQKLRQFYTALENLTITDPEMNAYKEQTKSQILYKLHQTRPALEYLSIASDLINMGGANTKYTKILKINEYKNYIKIYTDEQEKPLLKKYLGELKGILE